MSGKNVLLLNRGLLRQYRNVVCRAIAFSLASGTDIAAFRFMSGAPPSVRDHVALNIGLAGRLFRASR